MIGVSCTNLASENVEKVLERVSKDFQHWEIISEGEHHLPYVVDRLKDAMPSYDMTYSIHAPISDVNLGSLSERMREASTMEILLTMECAATLGIETVTIHPGHRPFIVDGIPDARAEAMTRKSLRIIDRLSKDFGVKVALENMPDFFMLQGRSFEEFNSLIEGSEIGICFDIGHANTVGQMDEFLSLKDRFVNVHVHDNDGSGDQHLTVGDGNAPVEKALRSLNSYKGNLIIEAKSLESAVESRERMLKMFQ